MSNIYQIDQAILDLVDRNTGEIIDMDAYDLLAVERDRKIRNTIAYWQSLDAELIGVTEKRKQLQAREKSIERKMDRVLSYIEYGTGGQAYKCAEGEVVYTPSKAVLISDEPAFIEWAEREDFSEYLNYKAPTVSKDAIKNALDRGVEVPYASIEHRNNCKIKKYREES